MKGVYNEFAFVLLFEFLFRHLNVLISIFGIIFNILHFSVLIRKPLRTEPVFIMMLVICICDLLQLFIMIPDDIIYINKTRDPNGCFGVNTYSEAIYVIAADILARFASFVSTWMAVLMVAFKAASIQFVSSSWSTTLLEPSTTYKASTIVIVISVIYISICSYMKFKIMPARWDFPCLYTNRLAKRQLYLIYGTPAEQNANFFFTMVEGYMEVVQLIFFAISTFFLVKNIHKWKKIVPENYMDNSREPAGQHSIS
uniref:G_PROTEIN_RECEP_F1_2 domain-containing protein n=1 Tax=Caenorhabditis tropicalis TaxID=1561998 RepID=A0A1I7UWR7_9PELO